MMGYEWKAAGTKQITYPAYFPPNLHVVELSVSPGGMWSHADLTAITGAPNSSNFCPFGYEWGAGQTKQVVFVAEAGGIRELYCRLGQDWAHGDLTAITGAPPAYEWKAGQTKQVVYSTDDGHIHELYCRFGVGWIHADLTGSYGAPPV